MPHCTLALAEFDGGHDYVHVLVNYPPKVAVSSLVNSLKGEMQSSSIVHIQSLQNCIPCARFVRAGMPALAYMAADLRPAVDSVILSCFGTWHESCWTNSVL